MKHRRFRGLQLRKADVRALDALQRSGVGSRVNKRIFALRLLSQGKGIGEVSIAVEMYPRAVSRVAHGYLDGGLNAALYDKPRRHLAPELSGSEKQSIVALCCGPAPEGHSRWTVRLLALEAVRRGLVPKAGRETVRLILAEHDLKPWREKNVVCSPVGRTVHHAHGRLARPLRTA
jgi:putative transposase